jgi:hypothetical protein
MNIHLGDSDQVGGSVRKERITLDAFATSSFGKNCAQPSRSLSAGKVVFEL